MDGADEVKPSGKRDSESHNKINETLTMLSLPAIH